LIYTNQFLNELFGHAKLVNETSDHFIVRCIYCGDSYKHQEKGHLAISKHEPVFRCVRCEEGGHVSRLFYDLTGTRKRIKNIVNTKVYDINKQNRWSNYRVSRVKKIVNLKTDNQNYEKYQYKLDYLRNRLIDNNDLNYVQNDIIVDLPTFINSNNIKIPERKFKLLDYFDNNFVGILSNNKSIVVLRNTKPDADFRYYVWRLVDNINDFIVIDNLKDEKKKISICMAEGFFDIINGKHYIDKHDIYIVATGKMFKRALQFIMINKCITYMGKISILSDDDVQLNFYKKTLTKYYDIVDKIDIYYNQIGKDFGDTKEVKPIKINLK